MSHLAGITSTGSKTPRALFGLTDAELPARMTRSEGCHLHDVDGNVYLDLIMSLGAVGLGYAHADVSAAAIHAIEQGGVGSLPPLLEEEVAGQIVALVPAIEQVRFLKTGAEAVAAAVRLARVHTGRDLVLTCGYHGWLDWCGSSGGIPEAIRLLRGELPFNDAERSTALIRAAGDRLAAVIVEPVIESAPSPEWLAALRSETHRVGAVLVFDEIKTAFRVALGGGAARWGGAPDLVVLGKALANGFPLAAVGGSARVMQSIDRTWISSTLATEFVALAAASATLRVAERDGLPRHLGQVGAELLAGLERLALTFPEFGLRAAGIPEMCFLRSADDEQTATLARAAARRGLLFKRSAYNFVSLAHGPHEVTRALAILEEALSAMRAGGTPEC